MTDDELRRAYQARRKSAAGSPPTPDELARLLARVGSDEERAELLDRALADPDTARDFEALRAIQAAARSDEPAQRSAPRTRVWLAAAAVVVIGLGVATLLPRIQNTTPPPDATRGVDSALTLIQPLATMQPGAPFAWHPVADALSYDVEVLDDADQPVAGATVSDTIWSPPDSVTLAPGKSYRWWVAVITRAGTEIRAAPQRFTVREP